MRPFMHCIITRFNLGMFNPDHNFFDLKGHPKGQGVSLSANEWMKHRMNLFITFTLPSVMAQTNQNFTWIVLLDEHTPQVYRDLLARIRYRNVKFVYIDIGEIGINEAILNNIESGDYDLITTRLDNDDAIHKDTICDIQKTYLLKNSYYPGPWIIGLPYGFTLDLASKKMFVTGYFNNANVSLIENSQNAKTAWHDQHGRLPDIYEGEFIQPTPYWIIVIHSQNLGNNIGSCAGRTVFYDKQADLNVLSEYGIDAGQIDAMSELTIAQIRDREQKQIAMTT